MLMPLVQSLHDADAPLWMTSGAGGQSSEQQQQQHMERLQGLCKSLALDPSGSTALLALLEKLQDGLASVENMPVHQASAVHSSRSYRYGGGGEHSFHSIHISWCMRCVGSQHAITWQMADT